MTCRWVVASEMVGGPEEMSGGDILVFQEMTDAVTHTDHQSADRHGKGWDFCSDCIEETR